MLKVYFHMYLAREEEPKLFQMLEWKEALALIGPRRAGKTTLALRLLEDWKAEGGKGVYFDMEALGAPATARDLLSEINKVPRKGMVILDEVQVLTDWVKIVRAEVENGKRNMIVTGSSATLLSGEIASSLGGRAIPETILPLSFRDAKRWGDFSLKEYLEIGGYPECVLRPSAAKKLHKLYLELTVLRDVAARKKLREVKPLSDLALLLLSEPGKSVSAKKTSGRLGISQPTFRSFVHAFNDAFLILSIPPYLRSPRKRIVADAKHYAYDTGLQASVSISAEKDEGRRLENLVAIELARRGYSLSYFTTGSGECDFIAQKAGEETLAVQVWGGEGKVPQREWDGLRSGMRGTGAKGLFLSLDKIGEKPGVKETTVKTIEKWMLEG
ncbi:AAA family ATPase [Candidatus Micrarchaeota archaeon]|nr:AAA family ATPase [Candidatus Micrarchaeota archaeon]